MTNDLLESGQANGAVSPSPQTAQTPQAGQSSQAQPSQPTPVLESAMNTGVGADDEPEMLVGDKHQGEPLPDLDGDGALSVAEAKELLGAGDKNKK